MLLALWRVLAIGVLALPVRSVITDDLGEWDTEGLGYAFCGGKKGDKSRERRG